MINQKKIIDKKRDKTYPIHHLCGLFPWMDENTMDALKEDMSEHGQRDTIKVFQGEVLDGKNRMRACLDLGIEPKIEVLPENTNLYAYVKAVGLCRRDLTPDQRIDIATEIDEYKLEQEGKKERVEELMLDEASWKLYEDERAKRIAKEANSTKETAKKYLRVKRKANLPKPQPKEELEEEEEEKDDPDTRKAREELTKIKKGKSITRAYNAVFPKVNYTEEEKPSKEDVEEELVEAKHEIKTLENRFNRVVEILKKHEIWTLVKEDLFPILKEVKTLQPTIKEMREAELL